MNIGIIGKGFVGNAIAESYKGHSVLWLGWPLPTKRYFCVDRNCEATNAANASS
jgi:hypothetical protein